MRCNEYKLTASAYLDREIGEAESSRYRAHLSACEACRGHLAETAAASRLLRDLPLAEQPAELHGYVMNSIGGRIRGEITVATRVSDWLMRLNPLPLSYGTGAIVSAVLFTVLLSAFKPMLLLPGVETIPAVSRGLGPTFVFPIVTSSDAEYHHYNGLPEDTPALGDGHFYQLPRVLDNSPLVSFSNVAYQKPGNQEGIAALIEVNADGSAKLVDVLNGKADAEVIHQLWWSLKERAFQPALVGGRPVSTRIVLVVEKVDVNG